MQSFQFIFQGQIRHGLAEQDSIHEGRLYRIQAGDECIILKPVQSLLPDIIWQEVDITKELHSEELITAIGRGLEQDGIYDREKMNSI